MSGASGIGQGEGNDLNHIHSPSGFITTYQQQEQETGHLASPCPNAMNLNIATLLHVFNNCSAGQCMHGDKLPIQDCHVYILCRCLVTYYSTLTRHILKLNFTVKICRYIG